jgi:hypothetical protein
MTTPTGADPQPTAAGEKVRADLLGVITEALVWSESGITRVQAMNAAPQVREWLEEHFDFVARHPADAATNGGE